MTASNSIQSDIAVNNNANFSNSNNNRNAVTYQADSNELINRARQGDPQALRLLETLIFALQSTATNTAPQRQNNPLDTANQVNGSIRGSGPALSQNGPKPRSSHNGGSGGGASFSGLTHTNSNTSGIGGISSRTAGGQFANNGSGDNFGGGGSFGSGTNGGGGATLLQGANGSSGIFSSSNNIFNQVSELLKQQERIGVQSAELQASSAALSRALQALSSVAQNIRG